MVVQSCDRQHYVLLVSIFSWNRDLGNAASPNLYKTVRPTLWYNLILLF